MIVNQVIKATLESTADVRSWNIVSSHANAAPHTCDRLVDMRKPEIMKFQIVA
jgi:hypothetical protein